MLAGRGLKVPVLALEQRPTDLKVFDACDVLELDQLVHLFRTEIPVLKTEKETEVLFFK